jgi:protein involved in polysaccharide export with SLBB domain
MISTRRASALMLRELLHVSAVTLFAASLSSPAGAQGSTAPVPTRNAEATRADLETQLAGDRRDTSSGSVDDRARRSAEIATIQDRLTNGDFLVGDRIVLSVAGQAALTDTFTVREGQILRLPTLSDVSLHGVLRSELQGHLYAEISRFLRDPVVRSGSLIRLSVLGPVQRPGFYALPADMLLSNAIMYAGGLAGNANVNKTVIKRGGQIIWPELAVASAIRQGETIDQLNLRAGDEIDVGEKGGSFLTVGLPVIGAVVAVVTAVILIARH